MAQIIETVIACAVLPPAQSNVKTLTLKVTTPTVSGLLYCSLMLFNVIISCIKVNCSSFVVVGARRRVFFLYHAH